MNIFLVNFHYDPESRELRATDAKIREPGAAARISVAT